jgi:HAD superfamily hydrolase (TIGR01549 family)
MPFFSVVAFIFDIDGTLVDSNELHVESWDRAFRRFGKEFPREKLRAQIGKGTDQYLPEFLTPEEIKRFGKELDDYRSELFRKEYLPKVRPFPKVRELFQRIRDDNKHIVLATSGKKADTKYYIDLLEIDNGAGGSRATKTGKPERVGESGGEPINLIDGYVSGDDADNSKPAPDIFAASLKKLGDISPADAVTVGDTRFDIEAAGKAGLKTIAFLCGGTSEAVLREVGAVAICRDPADFLAHYDELVTPESTRRRL